MKLGTPGPDIFIASRRHLQEVFFTGYFFDGANYVSDLAGLLEYIDEQGFSLRSGLDGCYAYGRRFDGRIDFGSDFSGYKTLFYYHDGDEWVVGDSLWRVVEELRTLGVTVFPDYSQLGAICSANSTNNQMFSWNSVARGVKLLPRGARLSIFEDRAVVESRTVEAGRQYRGELEKHVDLWLDRYATVLVDERLEMSIDLTGGVDSRTNFALALRAREALGQVAQSPRFTCSGVPGVSADATIATELCSMYGSTLNPGNRIPPHRLDPSEGFESWKKQSLGVYYPLVVPANRRHAGRVHMSGGGGEVHRDYYARATVRDFFEGHMRRNIYPWLGFEAGEVGFRDALRASNGRDESPLRANYREFRHRLHAGRSPRQSTSFTPLDSTTAERANLSAGRGAGSEARFNYDVLGSLLPALLELPFDKPGKSPSAELLSDVPQVRETGRINPGRTYGDFEAVVSQRASFSAAARIVPFADAIDEAVEFPSVRAFLGDEIIRSAKGLVASVREGGSMGNPVNGHPISAVLSTAMVAPEANAE